MFVVNNERCVWWPVRVEVPYDGGTTKVHEFEARFRLPPPEEGKKRRAPAMLDSFDAARKGITDWRGIARALTDDLDGPTEPLPFNEENLRLVLASPRAVQALAEAYLECIAGIRRKNSSTPRVDGPAADPQKTA